VRDATRAAVATLVLATALAASTGAAGAATKPAACTLLTKRAVTKAIGEPAVNTDRRTDECWYESKNGLKVVNLIRRADDVETWRSGYQNNAWTTNDYGDEGYTGTALDSVVWRDGKTEYEVNVVYSTKGNPRTAVEKLAEQVNAKLN
jgi:hypothetical protein